MEQWLIEALIPHRPPFLLVDRIIELEPGRRAVGLKKVGDKDSCLLAERKGKSFMPGSLVLEALAQVGAVAVLSLPEHQRKITLMTGIENASFYREVLPGEEIRLEAEIVKINKRAGKRRCRATVGGQTVAEGDLLFMFLNQPGP